MTNNEAIKWLGNLRNDLGNPHYECLWPYAQAIDEICELLEEQEPVEPKEMVDDFYPIGDPLRTIGWQCGHCGERIACFDRFCPKCGRKVDWDAAAD